MVLGTNHIAGMGNEQHYQNTPVEQSFVSDHHYLRLDSALNVYDDNVHLPAHLVELGGIPTSFHVIFADISQRSALY